ncbi:cell division protein FtsA [Tumebacillus algifaecis]|uniref:cell division protein FtsA n=1 Tax=Tumebacillus algifaecis TaxID=1214604 RepID=UPI0012FD1BB1|nr:cell division FtsA domain-containing protein [Tumebacillus algifaecis]
MAQHDEQIFALDIGTRSVVGLVARFNQEGQLEIAATVAEEHATRAMLDGQIHDVSLVADVIRKVKTRLESKTGPLRKVAVAAAGRSLKTVRARVDRNIQGERVTRDVVLALELTAVQQAERHLQELTPDASRYHCVGYTVVHYSLDDSVIGSLEDQIGLKASVEIIATFLPRVVIDSLQMALERADLEMAALTLEPIAAINALIPPSMRKLNLVLVDIGAGTSDIALTAEGTVVAYGMVPVAGDEITEALSQRHLLDFPDAEQLKRRLMTEEHVEFNDVLGMGYSMPARDVIESIQEEVRSLATQISYEIFKLNQKAPAAVMLVGGGSQTPMLGPLLAAELKLPKERVAIRGTDAIKQLAEQHEALSGPQAVTPIGIALAALQHPVSSVAIHVNGKSLRLFEFRQITVGDCLIAADVEIRKLHGRPGLALSVEVQGELKVIRGTLGTPAQLLLNGQPAKLDDIVQHGDELEVIGGVSGVDASAVIGDLLPPHLLPEPLSILFRGETHMLPARLLMNGELATTDTHLTDRAKISVERPTTVDHVLQALPDLQAYERELLDLPHSFAITLDGESVTMPHTPYEIMLNDLPATLDTAVQSGDTLHFGATPDPHYTVRFFYDDSLHPGQAIGVICNNRPINLEGPRPPIYLNGKPAGMDDLVRDGDSLIFKPQSPHTSDGADTPEWQPVVSDLFRYIRIEDERPPGALDLKLSVNALPATFMTPIKHGDLIIMQWV